ncbi:MAG: hypothetical protein IPM53_25105 [Anaerolineaceae bacterium]|nr:hypothetical protein [Anaerolineaceae bacterium]
MSKNETKKWGEARLMGMIEKVPPLNLTVRFRFMCQQELGELKRRDSKNIPDGGHLATIETNFPGLFSKKRKRRKNT